jgi:carbamate kinase
MGRDNEVEAVAFVEGGGTRAIISSLNRAVEALAGRTGTMTVP